MTILGTIRIAVPYDCREQVGDALIAAAQEVFDSMQRTSLEERAGFDGIDVVIPLPERCVTRQRLSDAPRLEKEVS